MSVVKKVSAIILNTSKPYEVLKNVESLFLQNRNFDLEIIIVDNSGLQRNREILYPLHQRENVRLLFTKNKGYAAGNNLAASHATGEILFIINPDIVSINPNTFLNITHYVTHNPDIGILGPRQKNPDSCFEYTARHFPTPVAQLLRRTPLRNVWPFRKPVEKYEQINMDMHSIKEVDWIQSSFWAMRKEVWDELGGFDTRYFIFMSDVEMCLQAKRIGKKVIFYPEVEVLADGRRCSEGGILDIFTKKIIRIHFVDVFRYYWKRMYSR